MSYRGKVDRQSHILKASFFCYKITTKTLKRLPYILICYCTSLSPWFIILDKNNLWTFLITIESLYEPLCIVSWNGDVGQLFLAKIFHKATQIPTKVHFFHMNRSVGDIVIINDLKWPMLSYYVIYYTKFRKVTQPTEKEALNDTLRIGLDVKYSICRYDSDFILHILHQTLHDYTLFAGCHCYTAGDYNYIYVWFD